MAAWHILLASGNYPTTIQMLANVEIWYISFDLNNLSSEIISFGVTGDVAYTMINENITEHVDERIHE